MLPTHICATVWKISPLKPIARMVPRKIDTRTIASSVMIHHLSIGHRCEASHVFQAPKHPHLEHRPCLVSQNSQA
jgi:hypothetical protein